MPAIYALLDPLTGTPRYIGKANNPAKRLASHIRDSRRRRTPVYDWIRSLASKGLSPDMLVLVENCIDWAADERRIIAKARRDGLPLLNLADGGDEPECSVEVRRANAQRMNAERKAGTPMGGYWGMMRRAGQALRYLKGRPGKEETVAKLETVLAKMRGFDHDKKLEAGARWLKIHPYGC